MENVRILGTLLKLLRLKRPNTNLQQNSMKDVGVADIFVKKIAKLYIQSEVHIFTS